MLRARKGNELSVNTMIMMALAIMVLLLGAYFLIRAAVGTNNGTDCEKQGGQCLTKCTDELPVPGPYSCADKAAKCCIDVGGLGVPKK